MKGLHVFIFVCVLSVMKDVPDSCLHDNGGCEHFCTDGSGQRNCSCADGYFTGSNGQSCLTHGEKHHKSHQYKSVHEVNVTVYSRGKHEEITPVFLNDHKNILFKYELVFNICKHYIFSVILTLFFSFKFSLNKKQ